MGVATDELFLRLEQAHNWPFRRRIPLAVPTSFLVDRNGRITVIYRGTTKMSQVIEDMGLFKKSHSELEDLALPFPGRWHVRPQPSRPMATGIQLMDAGDVADAAELFRRNSELLKPHKEFPLLTVWVGEELLKAGEIENGMTFLNQAAQIPTRDLTVLNNLAWQFAANSNSKVRRPDEAVRLAIRASQLSGGKNANIMATLAVAYAAAEKYEIADQIATQAARLADRAGNQKLRDKLLSRAELFKQNQPYRDPPR